MTENRILLSCVYKLGHSLQEIRERALFNIISKLDHGFLFDNDLACSKELLIKLFNWFNFENNCQEERVLNLIKRIIQTESGIIIVNHIGIDSILNNINEIRKKIHSKYHNLIDDIVDVTRPSAFSTVPPLESNVPLSYRSYQSDFVNENSKIVGSTATSIVGQIYESTFSDNIRGINLHHASYRRSNSNNFMESFNASLPNMLLPWQPLVTSDLHVLESIEETLKTPLSPLNLINSCEFFRDVMLQDYPAEVFLQRPNIINLYLNLLQSCNTSNQQISILQCLEKFTIVLQKRIQFYNDPCTHNLKDQKCTLYTMESGTLNNPPNSYRSKCSDTSIGAVNELYENSIMLKINQLTLPHFCIKLLTRLLDFTCKKADSVKSSDRNKHKQNIISIAINVIDHGFSLLCKCIKSTIFENQEDKVISGIVDKLFLLFTALGESVEYYRLEVSSELKQCERSVFLRFVHITKRTLEFLIPRSKADLILPVSLKVAISTTLLDIPIALLYPDIHNVFLDYAETFSGKKEIAFFSKYKDVKSVNISMSSAIHFLKNHSRMTLSENIASIKNSLISLDVLRNYMIINLYVEICANEVPICPLDENLWNDIDNITLSLLGHCDLEIQAEMYKLSNTLVKSVMSPKLNAPGSAKQVNFILRAPVLIEIISHGIMNDNIQIQTQSEEILIYILKSKLLVPKEMWCNIVEALLPTFPLLLCHAGKSTPLGRIIIGIFDPDTAASLDIPQIEVLKGNLRLLFDTDILVREESLSRLCWLLATETNAHEYIPHLTTLQNNAMNRICLLQNPIDIKQVNPQHYYQPSSLVEVLKILGSSDVEPAIRRSALTQVSVMCEDSILHDTFMDNGGLKIILKMMRQALNERDYNSYPDSIITIVTILKNLCLFNPVIRQELSLNLDLFYCVLRGLMLFCAEDCMKQGGAILLCLLLYSDFTVGTPSQGGISLPWLIVQKLSIPFISQTHWKTSKYAKPGVTGVLLNDDFCKRAIRLHFCKEYCSGFEKIINLDVATQNIEWNNYNNLLQLNTNDLVSLQSSCIIYCCHNYLLNIQNATSHSTVMENIFKMSGCIHLYNLSKTKSEDAILSLPWESTLSRFFCVPPAGESDILLLNNIIKFLHKLITIYNDFGNCWIMKALKQPTNYIYEILKEDENVPEMKTLCQNLLALITECIFAEQRFKEFQISQSMNESSNWGHIIKIIYLSLERNDTQHFYNLAYLDCLLTCLVHASSNLGWSNSKSNIMPQKPMPQLVTCLCELINAFHCGKGPSAATSLMGLSITKNSLMILNHILAEMKYCNTKQWELCWFDFDADTDIRLRKLCSLWLSRDVIVRAAIFQLLAGIASSPSGANKLVEINLDGKSNIWDGAITILTDHGEASIVREQAASLITNLISHTCNSRTNNARGDSMETTLWATLLPPLRCSVQGAHSAFNVVISLLEVHNFFKETTIMISSLNTESCLQLTKSRRTELKIVAEKTPISPTRDDYNLKFIKFDAEVTVPSIPSSSNSAEVDSMESDEITCPGLIKCIAKFFIALFYLAPEKTISILQQHNLVKDIFHCLCIPAATVLNTDRNVILYCDILEMCEYICQLLNLIAQINASTLAILLNSRDCLNILLALINTNAYFTHIPHLLHLRNKMWCETFSLLGALVEQYSTEGDSLTLTTVLTKDCNQDQFLNTLCEAVNSSYSSDLQQSALLCLISLLRLEHLDTKKESTNLESFSMQSLLDNTKTPRSKSSLVFNVDLSAENVQNGEIQVQRRSESIEMFKNIRYNDDITLRGNTRNIIMSDKEEELMMGAKLCKILMHLYNLCSIPDNTYCSKKKALVVNTLTCILCISQEAKCYALQNGFANFVVNLLREVQIKLSLESADSLRRVNDRKRVSPLLKETNEFMGLLTNFMLGDETIKEKVAQLGLADLIHKLWIWCCLQKSLLEDALKMLCTFTTDCVPATQTLILTSAVAGSGSRKHASNVNLLCAVVTLITKEMELISRTHDLIILKTSFHLLQNCCCSLECRIVLSKSNLLQCLSRLHPALTKRQKPWECIELLWLEFLKTYTGHCEGQNAVAKSSDVLDIILTLTNSPKTVIRGAAMIVLRNIAFYTPNRSRLLASVDFLNVLHSKLCTGNEQEKKFSTLIVWSLVANNQKAKIVLKSAGIDTLLQELLRQCELKQHTDVSLKDVEIINYVCTLFFESQKAN